jgi:hypothetical protein
MPAGRSAGILISAVWRYGRLSCAFHARAEAQVSSIEKLNGDRLIAKA